MEHSSHFMIIFLKTRSPLINNRNRKKKPATLIRDREKKGIKNIWKINYTLRVYLNFFGKKAAVEHCHFLFRCHISVIIIRWFNAPSVCRLIWFPAILMHLFIHFHRIKIVDNALDLFLISILSSILDM